MKPGLLLLLLLVAPPGSPGAPQPAAGRRLPAKRGFCPQLPPGVVTICLVECRSDSECPGSQKCCSMGCHVRCTPPLPAKPGVWPTRRALQTLAPCNSSCSGDADCPGGEKCWSSGCGRGCLPPDGGSALLPAGRDPRPAPAPRDGPVSPRDICHLPPVRGPCRGLFRHYAYNPATGTCQPFIYSGCGGNANNFGTVEECRQVCQQPGRAQE